MYVCMYVGDLVIVQDDNLPAGKWPMARVIELHPGSDGYVRVVSLKTENGIIKRPVVKLSILPVKSAEQEQTAKDKQEDKDTKGRNCRRPPSTLSSIVAALLFFMTLVSTSSGLNNITEINNNQPLFFDPIAKMQLLRDQWTLVVYYDMSPYWDGTTAFEKLLTYLETTCSTAEKSNKCNLITPQLRHEYTELQYYNQLLLTQHFSEHSRQRRGLIDGIGYVANSLFGVLDQHFAEHYTRDIEQIRRNEAHLKQLWSNQTSIVESEYNLVKRTEDIMIKQHKIVNKHLNSLDKAVNTLQTEIKNINDDQDFTLTAISAHGMLQNLKSVQNMLMDTITDIYQGQFNLHLLTPKQLKEQLNIISGLLTSDIILPIDNIQQNLRKIYKLMKTKARMTEKYFIFEINIPLVSRDIYDLYHIITIPKLDGINSLTVTPIAEYVGINLNKDSYLPVTPENLQECIQESTIYLCKPLHPMYKLKTDRDLCSVDKNNNCKTSITGCKNKWTSLKKINTYFYFCCERCQLRTICGDQVTAHQLVRANIISLDDGCVIKTNEFTIYGHKYRQSLTDVRYNIETVSVAPINHIINITIDKEQEDDDVNKTEMELTQLYKEIGAKLNVMKQRETYEPDDWASYHNIHHYTAIYGIIGTLVVVGVVAAWRRVRGSWHTPAAAPAPEPTVVVHHRPRAAPRRTTAKDRASVHVTVSDSECEMKEFKKYEVQPKFTKLVFNEDSV
ncbi:uncharacterized protein LOC126381140 [Pectinophora gossypiella]|uniref:uncharacterized protein LOC126381140 n=1 Tax=Pectinophora gossypiella TaxID=13191 RepID=UPI00214F306B|nr:uncharacterized protein LOC126381140 [Pectinophora gossypiella]